MIENSGVAEVSKAKLKIAEINITLAHKDEIVFKDK